MASLTWGYCSLIIRASQRRCRFFALIRPGAEPPRRGFSLLASSWARAASTIRCSSSWMSASASSYSSAASASSSSESIAEAGKSPNTLHPVGVHPPLNCPSAAGNAQLLSEGLPRRTSAIFSAGNGYLPMKGGAGIYVVAAESAGGGRRVGEENLYFSPDGVGQPRFSLAPEPPSAPSVPGSACGRWAEKRAEPALFVVLGARLGRFFGAGAEKVAWGACWGRGWRCS